VLPGAPTDVAVRGDRVFILHEGRFGSAALSELFADTGDIVRTIQLAFPFNTAFYEDALAVRHHAVWIGTFVGPASPVTSGRIAIVDTARRRIGRQIRTSEVSAVTLDRGGAWVGSIGELQRFRGGSDVPTHIISLGGHEDAYPVPTEIDVAGNEVWSANRVTLVCRPYRPKCGRQRGTVVRVNARTNTVLATIDVHGQPWGIEASDDAVWVTTRGGELLEIDPATNTIVRRVAVGGHPEDLVESAGELWVAVR
jgi:DNA-binding beta-propeller fold protein YncE